MKFRHIAVSAIALLTLWACTPSDTDAAATGDEPTATTPSETSAPSEDTAQSEQAEPGVRLVSAGAGGSILAEPPADLVVLDVRTPEEFGDAHLDGAVLLDFYQDDFASQLGELDRDVPYLLYCRSGNRSGQAAVAMRELGFTDVADVDGGILAWNDEGLPTTKP